MMQDRRLAATDHVPSPTHRQGLIALVCALGMLTICAGRYGLLAGEALRYPYGIDYGEGIVWQQMHMVMAGTAYGPIEGFPAIAFPYPPLYYIVAHFVAALTGLDELVAGRLVSILAAVVTAGFIAKIAQRLASDPLDARSAVVLGGLAALATICTQPILDWSLLMRVDLLFVALSFAGFYFGIRALEKPGSILVAAVLFVAAIFTKQIAISAPLAVFTVLLFVRPRTALMGIAATLVLGVAVLVPVMVATQGGLLLHIIYYTITKFDISRLWDIFITAATHLIYIILACGCIYGRYYQIKSRNNISKWRDFRGYIKVNSRESAFCMGVIYLIISTFLLVTVLKTGSTINYFLEWTSLVALFAAVYFARPIARIVGPVRQDLTRRQLTGLWIVVIQAFALFWLAGQDFREKVAERETAAELVALIRSAPKPVVSDDMVALLRGGKPVLWEPFIFTELTQKGAWDEAPLLAKIKAREFSFFVIEDTAGVVGDDQRYTPAVMRAIEASYPVKRKLGEYSLYLPANSAQSAGGHTKQARRISGKADAPI